MSRRRIKQEFCRNCNTSFSPEDDFCRHCGQENHSPNLPIKHLLFELFEAFTHLDSKVFLTFKHLIIQPGKFTTNFLANRRMRYVPPIRLYIFVSAVFFFLIQPSFKSNELDHNIKVGGESIIDDEDEKLNEKLILQESGS
ncbi:MAG: DUF3667 domain-containing protein, partial [Saprospiraceae bacterium]